tara:strand:- start:205 stop:501 length:297 start_codon:yes stop_codon:yes gene_type:complete
VTKPKDVSGSEKFEFETSLKEIEAIVEKLDRDEVGLDEAIELFERGIERLSAANQWLDEVSGRVEELVANSKGVLGTTPLVESDEEGEGEMDESDSSD